MRRKNIDVIKSLLFYSFNKKNSLLFKIINYFKIPRFNVSLNNNFSLIAGELNFSKLNNVNLFNKFFCINFENNFSNNFSFLKFNSNININLSQNVFNTKNYNLLIPRKFNFEQNSLFVNIFGEYNDFTFMLYKIDLKTLKNDWNIIENFLNFLNKTNNKIKLSKIRKKFMPSKLKLSVYKIFIHIFDVFNVKNKIVNNNKNYFIKKNDYYYNDIFSKNNILFYYMKKMKNKNIFKTLISINSFYWLF